MQRITARFLLLIALLGTVVPIAMQAQASPAHACCLRKGPHHCHDSAHSERPVLRDAGCCNHDCCRAVTSSHWAHPQPSQNAVGVHESIGSETSSPGNEPSSLSYSLLRSRAPPLPVLVWFSLREDSDERVLRV